MRFKENDTDLIRRHFDKFLGLVETESVNMKVIILGLLIKEDLKSRS